MEFSDFLSSIMTSETHTFSIADLIFGIMLAAGLTLPSAWVYRFTQSHNNFAPSFVQSLFLFSSLTAVFTLFIGDNVAKAFGLIGALSIIRFRNALKEPIDAVYIFWALAIGMAAGSGLYVAAAVTSFMCCGLALILHFFGAGQAYYQENLIKVDATAKEGNEVDIEDLIKRFSKTYHPVDKIESKEGTQWTYAIKTKGKKDSEGLQKLLMETDGVSKVKLQRQPNGLYVD